MGGGYAPIFNSQNVSNWILHLSECKLYLSKKKEKMDGIELGLNKLKKDSMTPFPRYLWTGKKWGYDSVFVAISRENNILT